MAHHETVQPASTSLSSARAQAVRHQEVLRGLTPCILQTLNMTSPTAFYSMLAKKMRNGVVFIKRALLHSEQKSILLYVIFGLLTTGINIAAFGVCLIAGAGTAISNIIAWILAVLFAYVTNRRWVFTSENYRGAAVLKEFVMFLLCRLGTGVIDQVLMLVAVDYVGNKYIPANNFFMWSMAVKIGSNIVVIILNYIFSRMIIFTKK